MGRMVDGAEVHVLFSGYAGERTAATVSLVLDRDALIIVDPGMVPGTDSIVGPLRDLGFQASDVTDVILSHHHPDHAMNVGLFPGAWVHDHWAQYRGDLWVSRPAEGFQVSTYVRLFETPGHTPQDVTTLVQTKSGVVAMTHLWWSADGPVEDPFAADPEALHLNRARILGLASQIVPGHGPAFAAGPKTPP